MRGILPSVTDQGGHMRAADTAINVARGFCMALADSVPGVSGGTVAFILGFYDRFISSLDDLFFGGGGERPGARRDAVRFLVKIGAGWVVGFALSALVVTELFEVHIYAVSSLFMGFVACAIPVVIFEERTTLRGATLGGRLAGAGCVIAGAALVVGITLANTSSGGGEGVDVSVSGLTPALVAWVFVAAAIAISAMVLPGISGSTLMLVFGLYIPIMGAVRSVLGLDFSYLPVLVVFIFGVCTGIVLFVRLVRRALERFRAQTICAIVGMMAGSLFAISQGPLTLEAAQPAMTLQTFGVIWFLVGMALVAALEFASTRRAVD